MPTLTKKVFLSSTLLDLKEYRAAAVHACQRVGLIPIYMEDFPPDPRDAVAVCRAKVDEADLFLGVYAHRYGYTPDGSDVSITEMEYDRAVERGLPVHLFVMDPDHPWPASRVDKGKDYERLERFKAKIGKPHVWKKLGEVDSFQVDVLLLLHGFALNQPQGTAEAAGERQATRRTLPSPPEMHSLPPYILTNRFIGRRRELDELDVWARTADPMLVVEAIGGMGKSALTWEWTRERARQSIPKLAGILWWSFYEGGASMASFVREALAYVTEEDPEALRSIPGTVQAKQLIAELQRHPYLLVLDGFERLLTAYHQLDPSKLQDEQVKLDHRSCTDPKTESLLRHLSACAPSKILVTTRLMPSALENKAHQPLQGVLHRDLHGLTPEDGESLLRELGIHGDSRAVRRFLGQFDNHSLLIGVLAGRIRDFRLGPGNFNRWLADPQEGGGLRLSELDLKQRRTHILAYAFAGLDPLRRRLLSRIAVLSDAADFAAVAALNPYLTPPQKIHKPQRRGYQKPLKDDFASPKYREAVAALDEALKDLEERGLLQWDRDSNSYDLHPVVRGYAFDQLEQPDRIETYEQIRNHFEGLPPENTEEASELSDLKNTLQIYRALVGAGQVDRAADLYSSRLADTLLFSVAAYGTVIDLLAPLFAEGLDHLPALHDAESQDKIMGSLVFALARLGRIDEALITTQVQLSTNLDVGSWAEAAASLFNYSVLLLHSNRLELASRLIRLSKELSLEADHDDGVTRGLYGIMEDYLNRGCWDAVEAVYEEFKSRPIPKRHHYRVGDVEATLCRLGLYRGTLQERDLENALALAIQAKNPLAQQDLYTLQAELAIQSGDSAGAAQAAERALEISRRSDAPAPRAQGCLARALARQGRHKEARSLVEETNVPLCDAASVFLEAGDLDKAEEYALRSYEHAWADGLPYIRWRELEHSKQVLALLGLPEPKLPPFDPPRAEPLPFETEIRVAIKRIKAERTEREQREKEDLERFEF